jgi:hypothetical protein
MKNKLIVLVMFVLMSAQVHATSINATITADNHYALYHGNSDGSVLTYEGRNEVGAAGVPFDPVTNLYNWSQAENFSFEVKLGEYLYIAAWSDDSFAQGLLGQFNNVLTNTSWEYWKADSNLNDPDVAPTNAELATQIVLANAAGWTQVTDYLDHGSYPWKDIAGISKDADWIWGGSLLPGENHMEYQIFRKVAPVPEPGTMFLLGSLATGLFGFAGLRRRFTK